MAAHNALYGRVNVPRGLCPSCNDWSLIIDGKYTCCKTKVVDETKGIRRMTQGVLRRSKPSGKEQVSLLLMFRYRCSYCERKFGSHIWLNGKIVEIKLEWDHVVPFVYNQDNDVTNFRPACHVCNRWKHSQMFDTIEEIKEYVLSKWKEADTEDL